MNFFRRSMLGYMKNPLIKRRGVEEFIDHSVFEMKPMMPAGRGWGLKELRRKSFDDLQKLWFVLMKERNMLLTTRNLMRMLQRRFLQPHRLFKVRRSMAGIRQVIKERHMSAYRAAKKQFNRNVKNGLYQWPLPEADAFLSKEAATPNDMNVE